MQFYGLRAAKRLAREQSKVVKGQTDDWSRGYRTALKDLMYAIDQEIERQQPAAICQRFFKIEPTSTEQMT